MKALFTISILLVFATCNTMPAKRINADLLLSNGTIWTASERQSIAQHIAITDGNVIYVGNNLAQIDADIVVDLKGRFVMPGFIDNHVHFLDGAAGLASVDLRNSKTPNEFSQNIIDYGKTLAAGRWVLIGNWDHTLWGGALPHKNWIDHGTQDTPVFVMRLDAHMALANSAALARAGIDRNTKTPDGGEIIRDANGEPTGLLKDSAMQLVLKAIPEPSEDELLETMLLGQERAFSVGVTQVHAMTANPDETKMLDAFIMARDSGKFKLRAKVYTPIEHWQDAEAMVDANGRGNERLSWGGVKGMVDGSLGSSTAWFHQAYADNENNRGFPLIKPSALEGLIAKADSAELKLAIHAIGDKAIDNLMDAFEGLSPQSIRDRRFRIEHFQHPSAKAIERLGRLGIISASHPYHAIDDGRWAEEKIGAQRIKTTYAFRSILDAGGILSFGSDWPVAPLSPLLGVYAAVTRQTIDGKNPDGWLPNEKISVEEALLAYTRTNAYVGFEEDRTGTLAVGKRADIVVLDADPRSIVPAKIKDISVLATMVNGELVYGDLSL